ncbi:MAG TPA: GNAT family N-acetyltransferase [Steroidobacteraceae bacterium]|nr:GNAT family N-acetyltransferase [Steroidobacteraceae bacterium]
MLNIRPATAADAPLIANLVRELADYEKLLSEAQATPEDFRRELESPNPVIRVLIAEWNGEPAGFALYFFNFSTFVGRPGLYLEDLFVRPALRSHGIGRGLLRALARIARQRNCGRMEWAVLDWNEPALRFYRTLNARPMKEWIVHRLTPVEIDALAGEAGGAVGGAGHQLP